MKKNNKKPIFLSLLLVIAVAFSAMLLPLGSDFKQGGSAVNAESTNSADSILYPFVTAARTQIFDGKQVINVGIALDSNQDGKITQADFAAMSNRSFYGSAIIHVRTRNATAIAENGDYNPIDTTITLGSKQISSTIAIEVASKGLTINQKAREFVMEIYKVEVFGLKDGYEIADPIKNQNFSTNKFAVGSEINIDSTVQSFRNYKMSEMKNIGSVTQDLSYGSEDRKLSYSASDNLISLNLAGINSNWLPAMRYMSKNNMMKLGVSVRGQVAQGPGSWLYVDNGYTIVELYAGSSSSNKKQYAKWYTKHQSDRYVDSHFSKRFDGTFEDVTVSTYLSSDIAYRRACSNATVMSSNDYGELYNYENHLIINDLDSLLGNNSMMYMGVYRHNTIGDDVWLCNPFNITYEPINRRAKMTSAAIGSIRIDENGNRKLGLSVRFSEPVQFKEYTDGTQTTYPSITGQINGFSGNTVSFDYVMGAGTDTLYFEADMSNVKTNVTRIKFTSNSTQSFKDVFDFGSTIYNAMSVSISGGVPYGWDDVFSSEIACDIDLRVPELTLNNTYTAQVKRAHDLQIKVTNASSSAKIYYSWTDVDVINDESFEPADLTSMEVVEDSNQTIPSPGEVTGTRWLYAKVVSERGNQSNIIRAGPYHFDNSPPSVELDCTNNGYKSKSFEITIDNNVERADVFANLGKSVLVNIATNASGENIILEKKINVQDALISQESITLSFDLSSSELGLTNGGTEYGRFYLFVKVADELENTKTTQCGGYYYDVRDIFAVEKFTESSDADIEIDEFKEGAVLGGTLKNERYTIDQSKFNVGAENAYIRFRITNAEGNSVIMTVKEFVNLATGARLTTNEYSAENSDDNLEISIKLKKKIPSGLYRLLLGDGLSTKTSQALYFYVTDGAQDQTGLYNNITNNKIFSNQVYQLSEDFPFYYQTAHGEISKEAYGTGGPATFSSYNAAYEYVFYREYSDLYAVTLSQEMAEDLEEVIMPDYSKATGETKTAQAGQVWIRYKDKNWAPNSTTEKWAFYYYSDGDAVINIDNLSDILLETMEGVVYTVCEQGKDKRLVDGDYIDKYGAPSLKASQIHLESESFSQSKTGSLFASPVVYEGDKEIHFIQDASCPVATNVVVNASVHSEIYYKTGFSSYTKIENANGKTLRDIIRATGKFTILELDEWGMRKYSIYIDNDAPKITLTWNSAGGKNTRTLTSGSDRQVISAKSIKFNALEDYDQQSFVAIYQYSGGDKGAFKYSYTFEEFIYGGEKELEEGEFYVVISDRSGNSYSLIFKVKKSDLNCSVVEEPNIHIKVKCNREASEVTYKVYRNGLLVTTDYSKLQFTEQGYYQIYIEDIYGNVYDEYCYAYEKNADGTYKLDENGNKIPKYDEDGKRVAAYYHFMRDNPNVKWKYYQSESDSYFPYVEGETEQMKITAYDESEFYITTSVLLQFTLPSGCMFEFLGTAPEYSRPSSSSTITIKSLEAFTLRVCYENDPGAHVIYYCSTDTEAPEINLIGSLSYQLFEEDEIKELLESGSFAEGENIYIPSFIGFKTDDLNAVHIENGAVIHSNNLRLSASDENGIKRIQVFLNGELIISEMKNFENIPLTRYGEYEIVAIDTFANEAKFTFTNILYDGIEYYVDQEKQEMPESFIDLFDYENKDFNKTEYGHDSLTFKVLATSSVYYLVNCDDGSSKYLAFSIEDGAVYATSYSLIIEDGILKELKIVKSDIIVNLTSDVVVGDEYLLTRVDDLGFSVYASINDANEIFITLKEFKKETHYTVQTRIVTPLASAFFKTEMLDGELFVEFIDQDGNKLEGDAHSIKTDKPFKVGNNFTQDITSIKVYYSTSNIFDEYERVFDGTYYDILFQEEGFYKVVVSNYYGSTTEYTVIYSTGLLVSASVIFDDESKIDYSHGYLFNNENHTIYSNKTVKFIAYTEDIEEVTVNGEKHTYTVNDQKDTEIYLSGNGTYSLYIKDIYGNVFEKEVVISQQSISEETPLLVGFNEKALRLDENYTNQMLSLDLQAMNEALISYVSLTHKERTTVLYDLLSENRVSPDQTELSSLFDKFIGREGNGEYLLTLRDIYGNKLEKVVHYCETTTLTINRKTLNGSALEVYPIEKMLEHGVWTNNLVTFTVSATEYKLLVDGNEGIMEISYANKTKEEYSVSYVDEYGFSYEFIVHLLRQEVDISPSSEMVVKTIGDMNVTNNAVCIEFADTTSCVYTLKGGEEVAYKSGEELLEDGVYRFKMLDIAGNMSIYTIKRDSIVEYQLSGSVANEILINGGVTNGNKVTFAPLNSDSSYIKSVTHNGETISYTDTTFTARGEWNLVVADAVGNESQFTFHIVYGKMKAFKYNIPSDYEIVSATIEIEGEIQPVNEIIKEDGRLIESYENGFYTIKMQSTKTGEEKIFNFIIDTTPPQVKLEGCDPNEKTINDVTLSGYRIGETIQLYKDGKLEQTIIINSTSDKAPVITEGGKYKFVVISEAGISVTLEFERRHMPNIAGSVLIIVAILVVVLGLIIGLAWRHRSKSDE